MTSPNYQDESNSRRFVTHNRCVAPQTSLVRPALQTGSFRSGGILPRYAIREVAPMTLEITSQGASVRPIELLSDEQFPKLSPQGFFEGVAHTKSEIDKAMKIYKHFNTAKSVLHYEGSSLEDITQNLVARIEDLLSLIVLLSEVRTIPAILATVQLYVRTYFAAPLTPIIWSYVKPQLDKLVAATAQFHGFTPQAAYEDSSDETEKIISSIRGAITDWKIHRDGPFAKAFGGLISTLIAFGAFPEWEENAALSSFLKAFRVKSWDVQKDSVNFTDMVLESVMFFLERGYAAYKLQDLSLLFFSDNAALKLEREYTLLMSALPLLDAGKLEELRGLGEEIKDVSDYECRLEALIGKIHENIAMASKTGVASQLSAKLLNLKKLRTQLILAQKSSCIRERPFTFMIYGPSSVGKSELMAKLMKVLLTANNLASTKEYVCTLNGDDKYASEYQAYHNGVIIDDFGNTKSEHYDGNPTAQLISFGNNMPVAVLKADVESKGNIYFQAKMLGVTTNVKHLMAHVFSNEPVSILRRFDYVLDVRLRPEYVDPETGGLDGEKMNLFIEDAWYITLQTVKIVRDGKKTGVDDFTFTDVLKDASFQEVIDYLVPASITHTAKQKKFVKGVENAYGVELCEHFGHPDECIHCALARSTMLEKQSGEEETDAADAAAVSETINMDTYVQDKPLKQVVTDWYEEHKPKVAIEAIEGRVKSFVEIYHEHSEQINKGVMIGGVTLASIVLAVKAFRAFSKFQNKLTQQGQAPSAPSTLPYAMDEDENPWKSVKRASIPTSNASACTAFPRTCEKISKHVQRCRVIWPCGKRKICAMVPLRGSTWIFPTHMLPDDEAVYTIENIRSSKNELGRVIQDRVSSRDFVRIPGDLTLVNLTSGGPVPDLAKFLPAGPAKNGTKVMSRLIELPIDCSKVKEHTVFVGGFKEYETEYINPNTGKVEKTLFNGCSYEVPFDTYNGLCGAPVVSLSSQLMGFHLAGNGKIGAAGYLDVPTFEKAYAELSSKVLIAHSSGTMNTVQYGIDFTPTADIPPKHAVRFMTNDGEHEPSLEVYGAHTMGTPTFRSDVRTSPISEEVASIMNLPREHGKPDRRQIWKHWQRDLHSIAHTRGDFDPKPFNRARDDLIARVDQVCAEYPVEMRFTPLNWYHTINGINGVKWIDRINTNTSMGFPINKSKALFVGPLEEEILGVTDPIDFTDPEILASFEAAEGIYKSGERIYAIHRGNLKDEPTKFSKNKIRVFAGSQVTFTLLVRKYFLPVAKFVQDHGIELECAVGINAFGPKWNDVAEFVTQHGKDRLIAGDYKAFDKTASAKAMLAAFEALIRVAENAGYDPEAIKIMKGIATDISYPLYEFAGVILQALGSNPSGHPLTVIINNFMNSLYLRYAYYVLHPEREVPPFHEMIAALCYGDDNMMGVSPCELLFNHTSIAKVLADAGITYTMADKTSESVPLISLDEINFLKRGFRYDTDLKRYVAPIEVASISKMLHNVRGTGVPDSEAAMSAIYTANREFFLHGKTVFEKRHAELLKVSETLGPGITLPSWDQLLDEFQEEDVTVYDHKETTTKGFTSQSGEESLSDISAITNVSSSQLIFGIKDEEMLVDYCKLEFRIKPTYQNHIFLGTGEIDLVYCVSTGGPAQCIINIEVKTLYNNPNHNKGRRLRQVTRQAKKYGTILALTRNMTTISCIYTERGLHIVQLIGELKKGQKRNVFNNFLNRCSNAEEVRQQLNAL